MPRLSLLALWLCLLTVVARATPLDDLSQADTWARLGAYGEAESAYQRINDPALAQTVLSRRVALAQLRLELSSLVTLSSQLETSLQEKGDPEIAMRLALCQGLVAYRTGRAQEARAAYEKARGLAQSLKTPGAALALYECNSYRYHASLNSQGIPPAADYAKAYAEAYQPAYATPPTQQSPYWPLDLARSLTWTREWVRRAVAESWTLYYAGSSESGTWTLMAKQLGEDGSKYLRRLYQAYPNPEVAYAASYLLLELADGYPAESSSESWLATCLRDLEATEAFLKATPRLIYEEQKYRWARYHRALGRHLFSQKQIEPAFEALQSSQAFLKQARRPVDSIDGLLEIAGDYLFYQAPDAWASEAEKSLTVALQQSQALVYPIGQFYALAYAGKLKVLRGDLAGAEGMLRDAQRLLESWLVESGTSAEGKRSLLANSRWLADLHMDVLLRLGRPREALELSQRLQQQSSLASLELSQVKTRRPEVEQALRQIETSRQEGDRLLTQLHGDAPAQSQGEDLVRRQLASNKSDFYKALNLVHASDPDYDRLVSIRPTTFAKLQPLLPPGILLVEYYPSADKLYIFTATDKTLAMVSVAIGRDALNKEIRRARRGMVAAAPDAQLEQSAQESLLRLHQALIQPIEASVESASTLAIVPTGSLYYLPFSALLRRTDGKLQYLVERKSLTILTTLEVIEAAAGPHRSRPQSLLALANPDGTLPGAQSEVERFSSLFAQRQVYYGPEASKDKLASAQGTSVLHLATHGLLNSNNVNESYLVTAPSGGAEGKLTAGEIYGLNLRDVSLVTLSACQTALGESHPGAEISTLAQAFGIAGSRAMLASLWSVDDEATAQLMVTFYQQLVAGKNKAEALAEAQRALLRQPRQAHPFRWAAFEVIGDWR